jgi:DHA2 family multidrug resistance protein-like MFS transporter
LALMAVSIELMAMSVALPAIAIDFQATPTNTTWVIKAYQLGVLLTILPFSALGERIGYRRVYQGGLILYSGAALCCLCAPSLRALVLFRLAQGVGMSGVVSVNGALVRYIFPRDRLVRALGTNALIVAVFGAIGPTVASTMIALGSWRWIFLLSTPLCAVSMILGWRSLPKNPQSPGYDGASALLYVGTLAALFLGTEVLRLAVAPIIVGVVFLAGAALGITLFQLSRRRQRPLVPIDLLRSKLFLLSILTSIGAFAAQAIAFITLPFHLITAMRLSQMEIGPLMMAWPISVACAAPLASRLAGRNSTPVLAGIGLVLMAIGLTSLLLLA